jgi:hypothetical protein
MPMTEEEPSAVRGPTATPRWAPPPAPAGFVLLLLALFAVSYGVGSAAGPVAPGMHSSRTDPGGMGGMGGMGGGTHSGGGR